MWPPVRLESALICWKNADLIGCIGFNEGALTRTSLFFAATKVLTPVPGLLSPLMVSVARRNSADIELEKE
ncbi:hypothetical protein [Undibacterium sp. CCC3.4]|uniref:hypothetical protein n=1 Tax=Undibacterium sp. CCC3.4 TaxID=3048609 RepID=UPI002AC9292D|nr:hypothetical protein [Undibacterium sp. CCC3.4]MEB0215276.1 hypothetical protein [Undibacterium sp. 5I2]WPX45451.1 hypothetical protein RHM61_09645 [Undibacterium sp. CCC3.4]